MMSKEQKERMDKDHNLMLSFERLTKVVKEETANFYKELKISPPDNLELLLKAEQGCAELKVYSRDSETLVDDLIALKETLSARIEDLKG